MNAQVQAMREMQAAAIVSLRAYRAMPNPLMFGFLYWTAVRLREVTQEAMRARPFIPMIQVDAGGVIIRQSLAP